MAKTKPHPELVFEKKNKNLLKIPKNARIQRRPISHPPVASPYAGANVPKVVYVSSKTPFMSVVKRVQKLLREAEKRNVQSLRLNDKRKSGKEQLAELKDASKALRKEPVLIKATGRAIGKAMDIEKWFKEKDGFTTAVKTGTVLVVDDIVRDEETEGPPSISENDIQAGEDMELEKQANSTEETAKDIPESKEGERHLPDSRTRWINMVEVAVTLQ